MNQNRNRAIRGPQSALTSFLTTYGISAAEIRRTAEARRVAAAAAAAEAAAEAASATPGPDAAPPAKEGEEEEEEVAPTDQQSTQPSRKRKRDEEVAVRRAIDRIQKTKKKKKKAPAKKGRKRAKEADSDGDDDDDDDDDDDSGLYGGRSKAKAVSAPGQFENCVVCEKRFVVTPYTQAGKDGGLMCPQCTQDAKNDTNGKRRATRKAAPVVNKQRNIRNLMTGGMARIGAQSLLQTCVNKVADEIHNVEDFGDLSPFIVDKLAKILSRRRVINSHTLNFFLRPDYDKVAIYDAAYLTTDDFKRIFILCPHIKDVDITYATQFKDEVLQYVTGSPVALEHLRLHGPNLIRDDVWRQFFKAKGARLETVKLTWLDSHFDDVTLDRLVEHCTRLTRLKLERLWNVTARSVERIADIATLQHLTLARPFHPVASAAVVRVLERVGGQLQTLCLDMFPDIDDDVLDAIHTHCRRLSKLRITENAQMTDAAFERLFSSPAAAAAAAEATRARADEWGADTETEERAAGAATAAAARRDSYSDGPAERDAEEAAAAAAGAVWPNPSLRYVSLRYCRHVDAAMPVSNPRRVGLCSAGFSALMRHSGAGLEHLDVQSCRHIGHAALLAAFPPGSGSGSGEQQQQQRVYRRLAYINLSFVDAVNDVLLRGVFRACPNLRRIHIFGCFKVSPDIAVPKDVLLVGRPGGRGSLAVVGGHETNHI